MDNTSEDDSVTLLKREFPEVYLLINEALQQDEPDDYVIANGETHSVKEFANLAFSDVGLDWQDYLRIDEML